MQIPRLGTLGILSPELSDSVLMDRRALTIQKDSSNCGTPSLFTDDVASGTKNMLRIALHAYSSIEQFELEARLLQLVLDCHGWVLEERPLTLSAYRLRFEVGLSNIAELYGALQQAELQFTPMAHRALTEMCLCQKHLSESDEVQIVSVDLHVGTSDAEHVRLRRFVQINSV
jgi:hypothetical protein